MTRSGTFALACSAAALAATLTACKKKPITKREEPPPPPAAPAAVQTAPPAALQAEPLSAFADAAPPPGETPYDQARAYQENGQHWLARLLLEPKALGAEGTAAELELLASVCHAQGDDECVERCSERLGKELVFDAASPEPVALPREHSEPMTDVARARDHVLRERYDEARAILEPKVLDGTASKEEIRLLKTVCTEQGDRMCAALCDAKLR